MNDSIFNAILSGVGAGLVFLLKFAAASACIAAGLMMGENNRLKQCWILSTIIALGLGFTQAIQLGRESGPVPESMGGEESTVAFEVTSHERWEYGALIFVCSLALIGGAAHFAARRQEKKRALQHEEWLANRPKPKEPDPSTFPTFTSPAIPPMQRTQRLRP